MVRQHNPPVTIQVYLGSGKAGAALRENIEKRVSQVGGSLSEVVVALLKKADPTLFKGVENGSKR